MEIYALEGIDVQNMDQENMEYVMMFGDKPWNYVLELFEKYHSRDHISVLMNIVIQRLQYIECHSKEMVLKFVHSYIMWRESESNADFRALSVLRTGDFDRNYGLMRRALCLSDVHLVQVITKYAIEDGDLRVCCTEVGHAGASVSLLR